MFALEQDNEDAEDDKCGLLAFSSDFLSLSLSLSLCNRIIIEAKLGGTSGKDFGEKF